MALPIDVTLYTNYGKISSFLAASDFARQGLLKGEPFNTSLPSLLSVVTDLVEWNNDRDPADETLVDTGNYLYQLLGKYLPKAKQLIANMGQGTIVNPATGAISILAPFYIEFYVGVTASPVVVNGQNVTLPNVGDTSMTIPLTYIKQSLEIELDGISVPRVATDRIAANVNYTNNNATITLGPATPEPTKFQYNQLWVIQGDQYQTV
jgi:hypothetical protein